MDELKIALQNGYTLAATIDNETIDVHTVDPDGTYNQPLVTVAPSGGGEQFSVRLYTEPVADPVVAAIVMHHDADDEEDDGDAEEFKDSVLHYGDYGEEVKVIQRRLKALGFFDGAIGGNYLSKTQAAVEAFQTAAGLHVNGADCDRVTYKALMADDAVKAPEPAKDPQKYAKVMDWWTSDIQKIFAKGVVAKITDVETKLFWYEVRRGGTNHADVQPVSKNDTAILKRAYGGKWAWTRRAIWVTIDGVTYAASMNGMPHGGGSIKDNGFDGHHCLHWPGSRTHCSNKVCPNHQKMVQKAASTPLC